MSHKLPRIRINTAHNAKVTGISAAGAVYDPTPYDAPVAPDPDPYALYPATGDMSPHQQHDADKAEAKIIVYLGGNRDGLYTDVGYSQWVSELYTDYTAAAERRIAWLEAQLAALRGEQ